MSTHTGLIVLEHTGNEPIGVDDFIQWKKLPDGGAEDQTRLLAILQEAREWIENAARAALSEQLVRAFYSEFSDAMMLPRLPVGSVESVKYFDSAGSLQTVSEDSYTVFSQAGIVELASGSAWPSPSKRSDAVQINYRAGYGIIESNGDSPETFSNTTPPLPEKFRNAILRLAAHSYEHRELVVIGENQSSMVNPHTEIVNAIRAYLCDELTRFEF